MKRAADAKATLASVLPSLPMFLLFPALFRHGVDFWPALAIGLMATIVLYGVMLRAKAHGLRPDQLRAMHRISSSPL